MKRQWWFMLPLCGLGILWFWVGGRHLLDAPMLNAALRGNAAEAETLILLGAAPNYQQSPGGFTALRCAAGADDIAFMRFLLRCHVDPNTQDMIGRTPLIWAVINDDPAAVRLLLDYGAQVNQPEELGCSPLMFAKSPRVAKLLLDRGANLEQRDWDGDTAFLNAATLGNSMAVHLLLHRNADKGASNGGGENALHLAAMQQNDPLLVLLLIQQGVNPRARDHAKRTPWMVARQFGNEATLAEFRKAGVDRWQRRDHQGRQEKEAARVSGWVSPESGCDRANPRLRTIPTAE